MPAPPDAAAEERLTLSFSTSGRWPVIFGLFEMAETGHLCFFLAERTGAPSSLSC